jgi:hypothetical protein
MEGISGTLEMLHDNTLAETAFSLDELPGTYERKNALFIAGAFAPACLLRSLLR